MVPTEGEPAIVGNWLRERREVSDCFCIELTVCEVSREEVEDVEARLDVPAEVVLEDLSLATR